MGFIRLPLFTLLPLALRSGHCTPASPGCRKHWLLCHSFLHSLISLVGRSLKKKQRHTLGEPAWVPSLHDSSLIFHVSFSFLILSNTHMCIHTHAYICIRVYIYMYVHTHFFLTSIVLYSFPQQKDWSEFSNLALNRSGSLANVFGCTCNIPLIWLDL